MKRSTKSAVLFITGAVISIGVPLIATLMHFPVWRERGPAYVMSGFALLTVLIAIIPLIRIIKERFRSPSAPVIWLVIFLTFEALSNIADDMCVISLSGLISNLLGTVFFRLSKGALRDENGV